MSKSNEKRRNSANNDKLTMSFLYQKCNHEEENGIKEVVDKAKLTANLKYFLKYNKYKFLIIVLVIYTLTIIAFKDNPILIFYASVLFIAMLVVGALSSTYSIKLVEDGVKIKYKFQDYVIGYDSLVNIYMSRAKVGFFVNTYFINMIYIEDEKSVMKFTLPLIMVNRRELKDFFSKILVESIDDANSSESETKPKTKKEDKEEDEEILQKEKMKKVLTLFLVGSAVIVVVVVGVVLAIKLS